MTQSEKVLIIDYLGDTPVSSLLNDTDLEAGWEEIEVFLMECRNFLIQALGSDL